MAFEPRDNSGALFLNDRREKETHPNAKGSAIIGGVEFWVSAWTKTDRNGAKFQSLSFELKDKARAGDRDQQHRQNLGNGGFRASEPAQTDLDDEIPFD
jgi:hypothetical protein